MEKKGGKQENLVHLYTRICVRAKDTRKKTNKKADKERKAKKKNKERTETSVKAINMVIKSNWIPDIAQLTIVEKLH